MHYLKGLLPRSPSLQSCFLQPILHATVRVLSFSYRSVLTIPQLKARISQHNTQVYNALDFGHSIPSTWEDNSGIILRRISWCPKAELNTHLMCSPKYPVLPLLLHLFCFVIVCLLVWLLDYIVNMDVWGPSHSVFGTIPGTQKAFSGYLVHEYIFKFHQWPRK